MNRTDSVPSLSEEPASGVVNTGAWRPSEPKRTVSWGVDVGSPGRSSSRIHLVEDPIGMPVPPPSAFEQSWGSTPILERPSGRAPSLLSVGDGETYHRDPYTRSHGSRPNYHIPPPVPTVYSTIPSSGYYSYPTHAYQGGPPIIHVDKPFLRPFDRGFLMQEDFGSYANPEHYPSTSVRIYDGRSQNYAVPPQGASGWPWNDTPEASNPTRSIDAIFDFQSRLRAEPKFNPSRDSHFLISNPAGTTPAYLPARHDPPNSSSGIINFPGYVARQLLYFSHPRDAETTMSNLVKLTTAGEFDRGWVAGLITYGPLLEALVRLADS
ncbi:glycoside hydrolase family 6 protein, partial [Tulasnella calospora MUT 4182]